MELKLLTESININFKLFDLIIFVSCYSTLSMADLFSLFFRVRLYMRNWNFIFIWFLILFLCFEYFFHISIDFGIFADLF